MRFSSPLFFIPPPPPWRPLILPFRLEPAVLKRLRRSKLTLRRIFYYRPVIHYRGAPCADTIFLGIADTFSSHSEGSAA